ncbi:DNA utilization protein GntX [Planctomycetes bacterium Poly30]|uniref:DNA utilization protein GntX n=1 Tax=Saltatorellus ferox TaxID=2528018 RepID=A0A518ES37_9BACT|nr:DNA utilization protein GntX [Planctomycetes bacterium Poly30]
MGSIERTCARTMDLWVTSLASFALSAADVIWPRRCTLCGDPELFDGDGDRAGVDACAAHALTGSLWAPGAERMTGGRCPRCMGPLPPGVFGTVPCKDCRRSTPAFVGTLAPFEYSSSGIADWILRFKHGGRRDLARPLARLLLGALEERPSNEGLPGPAAGDLFVPVPLHPVRLAERGYDQASLLAGEVASLCGGQRLLLLKRTRVTHVQGALAAPPRRVNVHGAFAVRCRLPAAAHGEAAGRIWLVDDVMTSGATASACAAALRSAGLPEVRVLAIARA